ncbi:hypothetical protein PUMCH_003001 [Australozyma saopauloensis]|uniref:DNA-directed RNA polymerase III subunit n=1 Tax=Australozyma saopauloensis TaxID=291208 RepID=A0AAX4HAU3_9ASCO|nr:hypothetical protein PUMCH_003001 [[Candida] saopauloensis]
MSFKKSSGRPNLLFGVGLDDLKAEEQNSQKPFIELPVHSALSPYEESAAKQTIALQKLLYNGPFFSGSESLALKASAPPIERYSDRYKQVKKVGTLIDEYPYQLEFFPEELYSVMGLSKKKKALLLSAFKADGGLASYEISLQGETVDVLEKLKHMAEELDANGNAQEGDEGLEEDDIDDHFESDDDNDYNAERYFENGDDDMGDDEDDEAAF